MNQRDATVAVIEFVRLQAPDDKHVLKALKVLERRAEVLRLRGERRLCQIPKDIFLEPLVFSTAEIRADLRGTVCRPCGRKKRARQSFCVKCFDALDGPLRKALWSSDCYDYAFSRAIRVLMHQIYEGSQP